MPIDRVIYFSSKPGIGQMKINHIHRGPDQRGQNVGQQSGIIVRDHAHEI